MNQSTATSTRLVDSRIAFIGKAYGMLTLCIAAGSLGAYMSMGLGFPHEHPFMMLFIMIGGVFAVQAVRHIKALPLIVWVK